MDGDSILPALPRCPLLFQPRRMPADSIMYSGRKKEDIDKKRKMVLKTSDTRPESLIQERRKQFTHRKGSRSGKKEKTVPNFKGGGKVIKLNYLLILGTCKKLPIRYKNCTLSKGG